MGSGFGFGSGSFGSGSFGSGFGFGSGIGWFRGLDGLLYTTNKHSVIATLSIIQIRRIEIYFKQVPRIFQNI
jgi:hypothetical protein